MKIRSAIAAMVLVAAAGFAAAQQSGAPQGERIVLETLEIRQLATPPRITDVIRGYYDSWIGADFTNDRLVYLDFSGNVLGTSQINLGVLNLYPAAGKTYFNAVDASGQFRVGYQYPPMLNGMVLRPGFVPGGLAVAPDDTGVSMSKSPPLLVWFTKNYFSSSTPETIPGQPSGAIDVGPGGNWYIGTSSGVQILDRAWHINTLPNYTVNVTAVRGCGGPAEDKLWVGGLGYLDWWERPDDFLQASFKHYTFPFQINSIDCGQNGTVVAVGANRSFFYVDPVNNVMRGFQATGTGNFVKVSLGPGTTPRGLALDDQGNLFNFVLASDIQWPADRNTSTSRLVSVSLRTLF